MASAPTVAAGSAQTELADSGDATLQLRPKKRTPPGPDPGGERGDDDKLPDAALYTTTGRIKQRKWTLLAILLGAIVLLASGGLLLRSLRSEDGAPTKSKPSPDVPPAWAKTVDAAVLLLLTRAEDSTQWLRLGLAGWTQLANALEKANQPDLAPRNLAALQTRMYLARSRVDLLHGQLPQARQGAQQALRIAGDSGDQKARRLAGANAAWIHLIARNLKGARRALRRAGGPGMKGLLGLYAAVSLARGDVGMAVSQARKTTRATPADPVGWLVLAAAGDAAGIRLEAERAAARALSLAPDSPLARIQIARKMSHTKRTREAGVKLCTWRKSDPPMWKGDLATCSLRLAVRTAVARSDNFTAGLVLRKMSSSLADEPLIAIADLLLVTPGLHQRVMERILKGARKGSAAGHIWASLIGAVAALRLGQVVAAESLLEAFAKEGRWGYRTQALRAEILLRSERWADGLKTYRGALSTALRVGVTKQAPPTSKDSVTGACDRQPPRNTDHEVMLQRLVILQQVRSQEPMIRDQGLLPVLRMILRGEGVP